MPIRGPGQPGPRIAPVELATAAVGCEPCDRPPEDATISDHESTFKVIACHSSRDGFAAITLQDLSSGALVRVQKVPFEHQYGEEFDSQCARIQAAAREIVRNVAEAMAAAAPPQPN